MLLIYDSLLNSLMLCLIWFSLRFTQDVGQKGIPVNEEKRTLFF